MKLFIGTGIEGLRPEGYTTVDISPENNPDIVADAADMHMIADGSAEEFYASHVLEHFAWPPALLVLAEWARVLRPGGVLKVAAPDMELFAAMLAQGQNPFHVMEMIYGAHWLTPGGPQGHHYGYTKSMLVEIMTVLGFGDFDWWNSDMPEAAERLALRRQRRADRAFDQHRGDEAERPARRCAATRTTPERADWPAVHACGPGPMRRSGRGSNAAADRRDAVPATALQAARRAAAREAFRESA